MNFRLLVAVVLISPLIFAGCADTEEPVEAPGGEANTVEADAGPKLDPTQFSTEVLPGPVALRKLTREQFVNSINDLLGPEIDVPPTSEPDAVLGGLASVGASGTSFSPRGVESFEEVSYALASLAMADTVVRARLVPCSPAGTEDAACAQAALGWLARRAFRRPVTADELAGVVTLATESAKTLEDFYAGLEFGIAAILQSPNFLYRTELGTADAEGQRNFDGYELATRLSFFLWNTTPDADLLDAAEAGQLNTPEGLLAQTERLLESPRARDGLRRFFIEWLRLDDLESLSKDPTIFDFYTNELGTSAMEETLHLLDWMVFEENRDLRTLLTTTTTFVNPLLAALYGVPAPGDSDAFVKIQLPLDGPRAGLLGHASFLNSHSHAVSTSVTLRGKAVRNILLCQSTPDPPVDVDTSIPEPSGTAPTMRERVAEHLTDPGCAGCHLLMDPIGLGLERFDGTGRFRMLDNGATIDPSGDLDGEVFGNGRELGVLLGQDPAFARCFVRTMARYAMGRAETTKERGHINVLTARFQRDGHRVQALVAELVASPLFDAAGDPAPEDSADNSGGAE
ncbi:MAG: hypothetical protein ACI9WU_005258 [Myxococcota bacterium]|jgi:hypothetical protein